MKLALVRRKLKIEFSDYLIFFFLGTRAQLPTVVPENPAPVRIGEVHNEDDEMEKRLEALKN